MRLRGYQQSILDDALASLDEQGPGGATGIQLVTGAGKTVLGIAALRAVVESQHGKQVHAWLTHRRELRGQSGDRLGEGGLSARDMAARAPHERKWSRKHVNLISPQTRKWPDMPQRPGLLVVDEAHHAPAASWSRLIHAWQDAGGVVLGLSGTWWRMSDDQGFDHMFRHLVCGPQPAELQDAGWLSTPRVVQPQRAWISTRDAELNGMGEFAASWNEAEVLALLAQERAVQEWDSYTSHLEDRRTMWFTPTVHSAQVLADLLGGLHICGSTPAEERDERIQALREGSLTHLVSVDVLSEGLDLPGVPVIGGMRTTNSLSTYLQQCGRASRPNDRGEYLLLDFAVNVSRHGLPDADREWSLHPRTERRRGGLAPPPAAGCHNAECQGTWLHPSHRLCWNCGAAQWMTCQDCAVERRWTQFSQSYSACEACVQVRKVTRDEVPRDRPTLAEQRRATIRSLRAEKQAKRQALRSFRRADR